MNTYTKAKDECKQQLLDNVLATVEEIEQGTDCWDILERALDIEYTIDGQGRYKGATITTATGGPHIEINTRYDKVIGYWGTDKIERSYDDNVNLYEMMEEYCNQLLS